jgi:dTDP-4-amino-4,6-dideoxygalactose transaminase
VGDPVNSELGRAAPQAGLTIDIRQDQARIDVSSRRRVQFLDLRTQHLELADEILEAWRGLLESAAFIGGEAVSGFEADLAAFCGTDHAVGVANGTEAITIALIAAGLQPGDHVITAANTFFATVEAITNAGGVPVLADVEAETGTLSPDAFERAITPRTRFVIAVHLYGQPADMDPIVAVARDHNIKVVEDNAQALGARYHGRRTGSLGDVATTSFYPGKNLGACGDGGAITTSDPVLAERARILANHGQQAKYQHVLVGFNSRLDALQAAALRIKLRHLDAWNGARRATAHAYNQGLDRLGVRRPIEAAGREHVYHLYVVRDSNRTQLQTELEERGIGTGLHYPVPIHLTPPYRDLGHGPGSFPHSEDWAASGISLPMDPHLTGEDRDAVLTAFREALEEVDVLTSRSA